METFVDCRWSGNLDHLLVVSIHVSCRKILKRYYWMWLSVSDKVNVLVCFLSHPASHQRKMGFGEKPSNKSMS